MRSMCSDGNTGAVDHCEVGRTEGHARSVEDVRRFTSEAVGHQWSRTGGAVGMTRLAFGRSMIKEETCKRKSESPHCQQNHVIRGQKPRLL